MAAVMSYSVDKEHILKRFLLHILIVLLYNKDDHQRECKVWNININI